MIGPETAGYDTFRDHPYAGNPRVAAQAAHIYNAGVKFTQPDFFERLRVTLRNGDIEAKDKQVKKVFMTEYANLADHQRGDPLLLARSVVCLIRFFALSVVPPRYGSLQETAAVLTRYMLVRFPALSISIV